MAAPAPDSVLSIGGPLDPADVPVLYARVCALLEQDSGDTVCDVAEVRCDAVSVDALARVQLAAKRSGRRLRLRGASDELLDLISFMGLQDVVGDR